MGFILDHEGFEILQRVAYHIDEYLALKSKEITNDPNSACFDQDMASEFIEKNYPVIKKLLSSVEEGSSRIESINLESLPSFDERGFFNYCQSVEQFKEKTLPKK